MAGDILERENQNLTYGLFPADSKVTFSGKLSLLTVD